MNEQLIRAERALVGLSIIDPSVIDRLELEIGAYAFIDDASGVLWPILCRMRSEGKPCGDFQALAIQARQDGCPPAEIAKITEDAGFRGDIDFYSSELKTEQSRRLIRRLSQDALLAVDHGRDPFEVIEQLESGLQKVAPIQKSKSLSDLVHEVIQRSETKDVPSKVDTCLPSLDRSLGGLRAGQLIVLAARPSVGKSALAAQIAIDSAKDNHRVLFVSMEMPSTDIVCRLLASELGVEFSRVQNGLLQPEEIQQGRKLVGYFRDVHLEIEDRRNMSIQKLVHLIRGRSAHTKFDLVVIDYLGLIQGDRKKPRWEAITEISGQLKTLALAEQIPILALCQLNRDSEGEVPKLSHLRDSGSIEQDADAVILLHRERGSTDCELILAKNRNGAVGKIKLEFDPKALRFKEGF